MSVSGHGPGPVPPRRACPSHVPTSKSCTSLSPYAPARIHTAVSPWPGGAGYYRPCTQPQRHGDKIVRSTSDADRGVRTDPQPHIALAPLVAGEGVNVAVKESQSSATTPRANVREKTAPVVRVMLPTGGP